MKTSIITRTERLVFGENTGKIIIISTGGTARSYRRCCRHCFMKRKPVVIAYDITCDKRRRQLFRVLKTWKLDAQYSVFECRLTDPEAKELFLQLTALLDEKEDVLLLTWLDNTREAMAVTRCGKIGFKIPIVYAG